MAKIIVKVPSVSSGKGAGGMVDYVAKREGVDKSVNRSVTIKAPTQKQMDYINELVKMCPDAKESFEYEDYIENPTRQNASAFISVVAEHNPHLFEDKETYLNYIATRPNVEKGPEHGLFGNEDNINLPEVKKGLSEHKAVVWLPIISLRREDASLLGYDNAESWRDLIRSKQMDMAKAFGMTDFIMLDYIYQSVETRKDVDTYILFTGDGHFQSVVKYLRQRKKNVIICGVRETMSNQLRSVASEILELPIEEERDINYYRLIASNMNYVEQFPKIVPTFMRTVENVAKKNNLPEDLVTDVLRRMIQKGYITKKVKKMSNGDVRYLEACWDKMIEDGIC